MQAGYCECDSFTGVGAVACFALIFFAGQRSLIEMNPNVTLVYTPHDRLHSPLSVSSLITKPNPEETKGAANPIVRGQPVPQRVPSAAAMLHPPQAEKLLPERVEPPPSTGHPPRSDVSILGQQPSSRLPAKLRMKSRTVKVEGVNEDWDADDYEMAFNDEEKGGGEIEEHGIVLKGSTAYVTFKDPIGKNMCTMVA